jgi:excisionase family DNA binding protein
MKMGTESKKPLETRERLWTTDEAMEFFQVKRSKFYLMLATEDIPRLRIGGQVRFIPEQLLAWAKKKSAS